MRPGNGLFVQEGNANGMQQKHEIWAKLLVVHGRFELRHMGPSSKFPRKSQDRPSGEASNFDHGSHGNLPSSQKDERKSGWNPLKS